MKPRRRANLKYTDGRLDHLLTTVIKQIVSVGNLPDSETKEFLLDRWALRLCQLNEWEQRKNA